MVSFQNNNFSATAQHRNVSLSSSLNIWNVKLTQIVGAKLKFNLFEMPKIKLVSENNLMGESLGLDREKRKHEICWLWLYAVVIQTFWLRQKSCAHQINDEFPWIHRDDDDDEKRTYPETDRRRVDAVLFVNWISFYGFDRHVQPLCICMSPVQKRTCAAFYMQTLQQFKQFYWHFTFSAPANEIRNEKKHKNLIILPTKLLFAFFVWRKVKSCPSGDWFMASESTYARRVSLSALKWSKWLVNTHFIYCRADSMSFKE